MGDHYLPRFLLKGFARAPARAKGHPVVVTYDLDGMQSGRELTIAAVANETGMYGEYEARLQQDVEQPANIVLERLRSQGGPIDRAEVPALARYVITAIRRVPQGRERALASVPQVTAETLQELRDELDRWARQELWNGTQVDDARRRVDAAFDTVLGQSGEWLWRSTLMPKMFEETVAGAVPDDVVAACGATA
ncbi:Uncharacterised protein [Xylophilus ampelinus]|nr:Uncharacterised protein [Xylophilus ampelinus]